MEPNRKQGELHARRARRGTVVGTVDLAKLGCRYQMFANIYTTSGFVAMA